jgi:D-3-phosphoglycerate dehydrogenase
MFKIKTLNKIDSEGLTLLPSDNYEIDTNIESPDAIILRSYNMHNMELLPPLKAVARAGAGINNIPVEKCTEKGIVVFNTPGANANGVKELVIAGLLLVSRDIIQGAEWAKTLIGKGDEVPALIEQGKKSFAGQEIQGKTLAVIGLGAIGIQVANVAWYLGMKVIGYDPYMSVNRALQLNNHVKFVNDVQALLSHADYVTLNVPLTHETKNYICEERLQMMKNDVRILNFSRGGLVDLDALENAIETGKVARYITDFPNERLLKMKNTIAIPHLGASTTESETNCAIMAVKQIKNFLESGNIKNSVNFPEAEMDRNGGARILIANQNIPKMVSQISSVLASEGLNIDNLLNRKHENIAYNIIDVNVPTLDLGLQEKLKSIEGVFMVRIIQA